MANKIQIVEQKDESIALVPSCPVCAHPVDDESIIKMEDDRKSNRLVIRCRCPACSVNYKILAEISETLG